MNIDLLFKSYFLETLVEPLVLEGEIVCNDTYAPPKIQENINSLHIFRDENYNLQVTAKGLSANTISRNSLEVVSKPSKGTIINGRFHKLPY